LLNLSELFFPKAEQNTIAEGTPIAAGFVGTSAARRNAVFPSELPP
jgi:hypothetical protein